MWLQINCIKRNFVICTSQYVIRLIEDVMHGTLQCVRGFYNKNLKGREHRMCRWEDNVKWDF